MELGDKDKFGQEKRGGDSVNYHSPGLSSDWRFGSSNLSNTSIGLVPADNCIEVCKGNLIGSSTSSSVPMVDSISSPLWDQSNAQNLGLCDSNTQASVSTSNTVGIRKGVPGSLNAGMDKGLDMSWNLPSSIARGGLFLQNSGGVLPQSLSQFPADSAFIERAARFSCFSAGNFVDMVNPFNASDSLGPYSRVGGVIQGQPEVLPRNGLKLLSGIQSQKNEVSPSEVAKDVSLSVELGNTGGSLTKNERECGGFVRPPDEVKQGIGSSSNESDEAEFSGGCGLEETVSGGPSAKGLGSKKRKRSAQDSELDQNKGALQLPSEAAKDDNEIKQKGHQNPITATTKPIGKQGKDGSQASDAPKEDYIHVRARRGQATNSHSLAERVRREKISERMKFLQDLVPGCSKVTGKAVMLDEIINYVQSLQRQVEFLSMKLAAVNPRLDFNIEGLLTKDILQSRGGPSSTMGFSLDMSMAHHQMNSSHQGLIQAGIPGMANPSDALRRAINSQLTAMSGGFKDPNSQIPHAWDDELHNVVQMNFGTSSSFNNQELNGSLPPGHMKIEL